MTRTSMKKTKFGTYIVTNYEGKRFRFQNKRNANRLYEASLRVRKKRSERMVRRKKVCWNCGKKITEKNEKKHYPINPTIFCKR